MDVLRVGRDVYGRETLEGMSWDLIWVFAAIGVSVVVIHAIYHAFFAPKQK